MIQQKSDELVGYHNVQNIKQRIFCNFSKLLNKIKQHKEQMQYSEKWIF